MAYRKGQNRVVAHDYDVIEECGAGTYGFVFKARHKQSGTIVAVKKVTKYPTEDGTPVEIKYLSKLVDCPNIIRLRDYFFTKEAELVLVFEFMETDLWRLISVPNTHLPLHHIKCVMKQLLEGLSQCHAAGIMHRDVKPSNCLINSSGVMKLADFGLATSFKTPPYLSNNVVSLYYRSPELLLGSHAYGPEIDVWSAGCMLIELFISDYVFAGANDTEQLDLIFKKFGTPTEDIWPGVTQLPGWGLVETGTKHPFCKLQDQYESLEPHVIDLASKLLELNPKKRISCQDALQHPWFWTTPLPSHPNNLPIIWRDAETSTIKEEYRKPIASYDIRRDIESATANKNKSNNNSMTKKAEVVPIAGSSNKADSVSRVQLNAGKGVSSPNVSIRESTELPKTPRAWTRDKAAQAQVKG